MMPRVRRGASQCARKFCAPVTAALAARGESPAAFDRRCIPPRRVARWSNTPGILPPRALPWAAAALVQRGLGATRDFHHGLLTLILSVASVVSIAGGLSVSSVVQRQSAGGGGDLAFRQSMFEAEDSRGADPAGLATLLAGLESPDPEIRRLAVRALGRLERADLSGRIVQLIDGAPPAVRAEAVNALGQSVQRGDELGAHVTTLIGRLGGDADAGGAHSEADPYVRGVVAETLGRLPYQDMDRVHEVEAALASLTDAAELEVRLGAVNGLESLARLQRERGSLTAETIERLRAAARAPGTGEVAGRTRRLALSALIASGGADQATVGAALDDNDPQVRRLAVLALRDADEIDARDALIGRALADESPMVRYDALGAFAEYGRVQSCAPLVSAGDDSNAHVALRAMDLLGAGCRDGASAASLVARAAGRLVDAGSDGGDDWHRPAHAIVALARLDPDRAATLLSRFVDHPVWQARMYVARAAGALGDPAVEALHALADDPNANVRAAALHGLVEIEGHAADGRLLEAMASDDYGLLRSVAGLLEGSPDRRAPTVLLAVLARLTEADRDTSRDPRVAILTRLRELGSRRNAGVLRSYLEDVDPRVAAAAAAALTEWTGRPAEAVTERMRSGAAPSLAALLGLTGARVRMASGAVFEMDLFPEETPATVARFARLARDGYYDGLTFHRVVPNFVIQGGSPGANEFMGDGPYMRDELGLRPHLRGAVGISTRGRDTGDAQIFIDLADNPRLDHNYTVFAQVTRGMDAVDAILEGAVIETIEILER